MKCHQRSYSCLGHTKEGNEENFSYNLSLNIPRNPNFKSTHGLDKTKITFNPKSNKNKTRQLNCCADEDPPPNVIWFKDVVELQESPEHHFSQGNCELTVIFDSFYQKGGRYTYKAENRFGKIEDYIDFTLKCHEEGAMNYLDPELDIVDQAEKLPYDEKWEYSRELLSLGKIVGSGAFGIVKKAQAKSICRGEAVTTVAVKMVRITYRLHHITALSRELKILVYLGQQPNIVNLLGACTQNISYGMCGREIEHCKLAIKNYTNVSRHKMKRKKKKKCCISSQLA